MASKFYKLTDQSGQTKNGTQWGPGVTHTAEGLLGQCANGLHAYSDPILAVMLNPIHADISHPRLWECEGSDEHLDDRGLKSCCRSLTTVREIPVPEVTTEQRVRFGVFCGMEALRDIDAEWATEWRQWARGWLDGFDRSAEAAARAARAAWAAAWAARAAAWAEAAAWAAAWADKPIDLIALAHRAVSQEAPDAD
jgi:hypothetical protein